MMPGMHAGALEAAAYLEQLGQIELKQADRAEETHQHKLAQLAARRRCREDAARLFRLANSVRLAVLENTQ